MYHDESTIQLGGSTHALWCKKGEKKFVYSSGSRKRLILSGAVNVGTGETLLNTSEKMNSFDFMDFLLLILANYSDKEIILITDNASWHKSKDLKPFLEINKRITIEYLPPYAPELNPIEKLWKWLKHCILHNRYYKKIRDLKAEVKDFGRLVNVNQPMVLSRIGLA